MKNIGNFITSPKFMDLAREAVREAVDQANEKGLPKAYTPLPSENDHSQPEFIEISRTSPKKKSAHQA